VNYAEEGMQVADAGFIKFGSRVDLFYHRNSNQCVLNQKQLEGKRLLQQKDND
jgi:hypothetical protein